MPIRTFPKEDIQELASFSVGEIDETLNVKVVRNEQTGSRRWVSEHDLILEDLKDNTFWMAGYERGLTEYQDGSPFEYDKDPIEFVQMEKYEKKVTDYKLIPD
jgi:hypothetical protein